MNLLKELHKCPRRHRSFAMIPAGCYGPASFSPCKQALHVSWDQTHSGSPCCSMCCAHYSWDVCNFITQEFRNRYKFTRSTTNRWCLWLPLAAFLEGSTGCRHQSFYNNFCLQGFVGLFLFPIHISHCRGWMNTWGITDLFPVPGGAITAGDGQETKFWLLVLWRSGGLVAAK